MCQEKCFLFLVCLSSLLQQHDCFNYASRLHPKKYLDNRRGVFGRRHLLRSTVSDEKEVVDEAKTSQGNRNLYEILQSNPLSTKKQLKRNYIRLAKKLHPDANIGDPKGKKGADGADFSEISSAWRLLSDPRKRKRYDRSLKAEKFIMNVESVASNFGKKNGPKVRTFF